MRNGSAFSFRVLAALALAGATQAGGPPTFTSAQLRSDLQEIRRALFEMPADLSHSVQPAALDSAIQDLDTGLAASPPLTRDAAWRAFATLNPLLADGHLFVGFVDWRADVRAHLANGGRLFPFAVTVSPDCELGVRRDPRASYLSHAGARIRSVDGLDAGELCERLMARVHGDTRAF